jgi:hypothetical protein
VRTLLASRGAKPGRHKIPEGAAAGGGAEERLIDLNRQAIEREQLHLPAVIAFRKWVHARGKATREMRKLITDVRSLEVNEDADVAQAKPTFFKSLKEFARAYQTHDEPEIGMLERFAIKWESEWSDFAAITTAALKQQVRARLPCALTNNASIARSADFSTAPPLTACCVVSKRAPPCAPPAHRSSR